MHHQRGVKPRLFLRSTVDVLQLQQLLEPHSLVLVKTEDALHEGGGRCVGEDGVYDFIDFFLRVVLDFDGLVGEETEPDLADVPHELVLGI